MRDLCRAGIVRTARGFGGGVWLARPAHQVSLRAVVEAIQGPIALYRCLIEDGNCPQREGCRLREVYVQAQDALIGVMERTTLADLIEERVAG